MKYFPNDVVEHPHLGSQTIEENRSEGYCSFKGRSGSWLTQHLKLIRRADEPVWPVGVPECKLPLPEGRNRWAYRGIGWKTTSETTYAVMFVDTPDRWSKFTGVPNGHSNHHYCEVVNDEIYTPPAVIVGHPEEYQKETEVELAEKPPLGIMPKKLWLENRFYDLTQAILRNTECPNIRTWVTELKDIYNEIQSS